MNIHKWKNQELNRLLMEKFNLPIVEETPEETPGESHRFNPIGPGQETRLIVNPGDTLASIAQECVDSENCWWNVNEKTLMKYNKLESNVIRPGQEILIPPGRNALGGLAGIDLFNLMGLTKEEELKEGGDEDSYTVKDGDTLSGIAADRQVPVWALKKFNNLTSDLITPGDVLKIPKEYWIRDNSENSKSELNENMASEVGHIVLDIAGMVPVLGEYPDIANAAWYVIEAEKHRREDNGYEASFAYLFALLSVASLAGAVAPIIGDLVPKGGKYAAQVLRLVGYMAKGGEQAKALRTTLQGRKAQVDAVVKMAGSKDSRLKDAAPYMMGSLSLFASGEMPQQGEGTETLEQAASSEGAPAGDAEEPGAGDDMVAVVDLDSEKETMSELRNYIKNIIDNG